MKIKSSHVHINKYDSYTFALIYDTGTDSNLKV